MGSKLKGTGVEFPDGTLQTTAAFGSSISTMEIFYASGNFVKPAGVTRLEITLVGGGASAGPLSWMSSDTYISKDSNGYPEYYGSDTSITIQGTEHKARGGWVRNDFNHSYVTELSEFQTYGGQAGYLGENGFAGNINWKTASTKGGDFSSSPDYALPLAIGGSGYGYEGGSLKDYADNFTVSNHNSGSDYLKKDADNASWAGGSGSHSSDNINATRYLSHGGNGGGFNFGSLGGNWTSLPSSTGTVYSGRGYVGGGGGALSDPHRYGAEVLGKVGGGGGGAGAGGGGGRSSTSILYGGAAGQVVTFQISTVESSFPCPIVIGAGGDGLAIGAVCGGGGGQGVVIIKY